MPEKRMSPTGGFLIQSREGRAGNFEVVFAWPDGGLVHYGRANDENFKWYGPFHFGQGNYVGATLVESDYKWDARRSLGNLEVLATTDGGDVHHYWRTNGGAFSWSGPTLILDNSPSASQLIFSSNAAPSMVYSGHIYQGGRPYSYFYAAASKKNGGIQGWERLNNQATNPKFEWIKKYEVGSEQFVGISLALTAIHPLSDSVTFPEALPGEQWVAAVCDVGNVHIFREPDPKATPLSHVRNEVEAVIGVDLFAELKNQFQGRPSFMQGDFGWEESGAFGDRGHDGNLELVVPHRHGGFYHFWRLGGIPLDNRNAVWGWGGPVVVPGPRYIEVSLIQSTFSRSEHGNLELIARQENQRGFDFYWRDENMSWHGPETIE